MVSHPRHYLFFIRDELPKPDAHLIQAVQCANAAANLGYATWLCYLDRGPKALYPWRWLAPVQPRSPRADFAQFYNTQSSLRLLPLAMPWPIDWLASKVTNSSTAVCKYYWPLHLRRHTCLVHSRDWNFIKAAIRAGVPAIYECHHFLKKPYEPAIAHHPLLQVAVTVIDTVRDNMVANGMPADRIQVLPNGFNRRFLERHREAAQRWRQRLLSPGFEQLVVYAGALYEFKGVDLLLQIASQLPQVKFALAGGPEEQQQHYARQVQAQHLANVELLGFLGQADLAPLLQAADALAHPHRSGPAAAFTSPLKLFDYMASGTPIVATRIPSLQGLEETPGIAAWSQPDAPQAYANALKQVLSTYPWRAAGYATSAHFVSQFSWENRIHQILQQVDPALRPPRVLPPSPVAGIL